METASLWDRVHDVWRRSSIAIRRGVTHEQIAMFEAEYGVRLPLDVRNYFLAADGTGNEMDEGFYRFWPLSELKPVADLLISEHHTYPDRFAYPDCFVFADHCVSCWWYAVRLTRDASQPAPVFRVTGDTEPGEEMAPSFCDFMERYADNPSHII